MLLDLHQLYILSIINLLMKQLVLVISLLILLTYSFDLQKAKVIEKVGDYLRKRTKFGEIFLHKEH